MDHRLIQYSQQLLSLTAAQQRIYLVALISSPIMRGSGDIERLASTCQCTRHTVSRALAAIRRKPILAQAITITPWGDRHA